MKLNTVHIFGFKTFAEKSLIDFQHNRTAIVGPNGSGKSNIVDAIKWVLGDQSTKSIRVQKMTEVIFNGAKDRPPVNVADVSIQFDNSSRSLGIDSDTVSIRRILYRDGNTEYKINNKSVRLRDVRELFYDSGVGLLEYAILEQGKIDQLLSLRPEQRLQYFDEAAGISSLRIKGRDIENNLARITNDLKTLQSSIQELTSQKIVRDVQAEELERFQRFTKELQRVKGTLGLKDLQNIRQEYSRLEEKNGSLAARSEVIAQATTANRGEIEEEQKNIQELERTRAREEIHLIEEQMKRESFEKEKTYIKAECERNEHQLKQRSNRLSQLLSDISKQAEAQILQKKRLDLLQKDVCSLEEKKQKTQADFEKTTEEIETCSTALTAGRERIAELRARVESLQKERVDAFNELVQFIVEYIDSSQQMDSDDLICSVFEHVRRGKEAISNEKLDESKKYAVLVECLAVLERFVTIAGETVQKLVEHGSKRRDVEKEMSILQEEERRLQTTCGEKTELLTSLRNSQTQLRTTMNELLKKIELQHAETNFISQRLLESEATTKRNEQNRKDLEEECNGLRKRVQESTEKIAEFKQDSPSYSNAQNIILKLDKQLALKKKSLRDYGSQSTELDAQKTDIDRKRQKNSLSMVRLSERIDQLEEKQAHEDYSADPLMQEEYKVLKDRHELLVREIGAIGKVNFLALDERKEIDTKLNALMSQETDIQDSLNDLLVVYTEVQTTAAKRVRATIEKIDNTFNGVFQTLFSGGAANIELVDDEDIAQGIRIIAKPPGKKPHDIGQLSGGERTLTAIALLFATFLVQPSPFCILDEVDAMLDDFNIRRFLSMLYKYSKNTQFVIVTHNVQTMAAMDGLVGVAMEELGVSRLVSVKINEELYANV